MVAVVKDSEDKFPKPEVKYQDGKAPNLCVNCNYFINPAACEFVRGPIQKDGLCLIFRSDNK
jgi:hypothetical protein